MKMDDYQRQLVWNPGNAAEDKVLYCLLGLAGETGELMEAVKKRYRDWGHWNSAVISLADSPEIASELGDVLWYLTKLCEQLGTSLEEIAQGNLDKLAERSRTRRRDAAISLPGVDADPHPSETQSRFVRATIDNAARQRTLHEDATRVRVDLDNPDSVLRRSLGPGYRPPGRTDESFETPGQD